MVKYTHIVFALLILLFSCQKEEEPLTGTITGRMTIYDQHYKSQSDCSGIAVNLYSEADLISSILTDTKGGFEFENIPYGKYKIELEKDKYIQGWDPPYIYHVGGYSPSFASTGIFEIPTYQVSLDSVGYYSTAYRLLFFLKVDGDTVISGNSFNHVFIVFLGTTPEVSKDNFTLMGKGYLSDWNWTSYQKLPRIAVHGMMDIYNFNGNIDQLRSDVIYMRMYPLANGQGYGINEFYPEALGKPSNVISFVWKDLTGNH